MMNNDNRPERLFCSSDSQPYHETMLDCLIDKSAKIYDKCVYEWGSTEHNVAGLIWSPVWFPILVTGTIAAIPICAVLTGIEAGALKLKHMKNSHHSEEKHHSSNKHHLLFSLKSKKHSDQDNHVSERLGTNSIC